MQDELIVNKVAESGLITIDLEKYLPENPVVELDIKDTLFMGLILKEKDFRLWCKEKNWDEYRNHNVAIFCSADAIIPTWAYMLIASKLMGIANYFAFGKKETIIEQLMQQKINEILIDEYVDKRIVIKGCSDVFIPEFAYVEMSRKLLPVAKSIMFGEPCSTVPIYKRV